jgi:hypothetical protein
MSTNGTFTFTTGHPIQLEGFRHGAAVSWAQDKDVRKRIKDKIEDGFDVFSDGSYPYEDYYKYVEAGFLQGIIEAETVNEAAANWAGLEVVASLSAIYRLDCTQSEEKITASYIDTFKDHPLALHLLSESGIAVDTSETTRMAGANDLASATKASRDT